MPYLRRTKSINELIPWLYLKGISTGDFTEALQALLGDLFMSLIHTCELNKVNPFEYLTQLQKHASELSSEPDSWMPWNYRDTLQRAEAL